MPFAPFGRLVLYELGVVLTLPSVAVMVLPVMSTLSRRQVYAPESGNMGATSDCDWRGLLRNGKKTKERTDVKWANLHVGLLVGAENLG
jgi:hypothetical protein